jgi:alpha-N-acetylglucosamine transferase
MNNNFLTNDGERIMNEREKTFKFVNRLLLTKKEVVCYMTINIKQIELEYNKKIYFYTTYSYKYKDETQKSANPFFGIENIPTGNYIFKNTMTSLMMDYLLMDFDNLQELGGGIVSGQQYKTDILHALEHLWD